MIARGPLSGIAGGWRRGVRPFAPARGQALAAAQTLGGTLGGALTQTLRGTRALARRLTLALTLALLPLAWPAGQVRAEVAAGTAADAGTGAATAGDRVLSLGGSVTEIVVALGAESRLIGRDTTSTYPERVQALPDVGYLRALAPEGVLSLSPDLILAEASAGPPETVQVLTAAGVRFVAVPGTATPAGVIAKILTVADALNLPQEGAALAARVQTEFDTAAGKAQVSGPKKRVLFVLSLQGGRVMAAGAGTEAEGMITLAGAENAVTGFSGYKPLTDEAILAAAPDVLLMMDRAGPQAVDLAQIQAQPALAATPAGKAGALVRMDGLWLLGFGPRTPEAITALHAALYGAAGG